MNLPKRTLALAIAAAAATFASCAPSSPQARIDDSPARYGRLSDPDKALVSQGKIRTGMTSDAVYLAWGRPGSVSKGGAGNATTERWTYTGHTPVWDNYFGYGHGYGRGYGYGHYGYYGRHGYYDAFDYGSSVTYIPYAAGVVHFTNGRVSRWEETGR